MRHLIEAMALSLVALTLVRGEPAARKKKAAEVYKNLQLLGDLPAADLQPTMDLISGSLGVRCDFCHVDRFDRDTKAAKQTARRMIRMVFAINQGHFEGKSAVSCNSCHRGQRHPVSIPELGKNFWRPEPKPAPPPVPPVDEILAKYIAALGGEPALTKVTTRISTGSRIDALGTPSPEEVCQKAPNKVLITTHYRRSIVQNGFNGLSGWTKDGADKREINDDMLSQLRREADLFWNIQLKQRYPVLTTAGTARVGGREAYVLLATPAEGMPEKLYFDTQTGLLLRIYRETPSTLCPYPSQTDYEDYREVDGIKLPFSIRWSIPGRTWGRKITGVKQNTPIDDARFDPPLS